MKTVDVLVIGAGPAGLGAALRAHAHGLSVLVVDEKPDAGGQIYRGLQRTPPPQAADRFGPSYAEGIALLECFGASGIDTAFGTRLWQIDDRQLAYFSRLSPRASAPLPPIQARHIVLATGALERPLPLVGWQLPGVMTVGAAQSLLKSAGLRPPPDTVLIGSGPLIAQFAGQIHRAGGRLQAILETRGALDVARLARGLPGLLRDPALLWQGAALQAALGRQRRLHLRHATAIRLADAHGSKQVSEIHFCLDGKTQSLQSSTVLLHAGLMPDTALSAALGLAHDWHAEQQSWQVRRNAWFESTHPGIYVVGDGGSIHGATAAALSGELAALDIAREAGKLSIQERDRLAAPIRRRWQRKIAPRPFLDALYPPPAVCFSPPDEAIVCRCETLTAGQLRQAIALGAHGPNQLKALTRAGMGACQGRQCACLSAALIAEETHRNIADVAMLRSRFPVKPVSLEEIAGPAA